MDALTYIAISQIAEQNGLEHDGDYPTSNGSTFSTWRGFTAYGPMDVTIEMGPLVTFTTVTIHDESISREVAFRRDHGVDAGWVSNAINAVRLEADAQKRESNPLLPAQVAQTEAIAAYINEEHVLDGYAGLEADTDHAGGDRNYFWQGGLGDERVVFIALSTSAGSAPSLTIDIRVDDEPVEQLASISGKSLTGPTAASIIADTLGDIAELSMA